MRLARLWAELRSQRPEPDSRPTDGSVSLGSL